MLRRLLSCTLGFIVGLLLLSHGAVSAPSDPELTLTSGSSKVVYARSQLSKRPDLLTLEVKADPSYPGKTMHYRAIPAAALFSKLQVPDDAVIQFRCLDGFSAPISKERMLNTDPRRSIAYIAIESAAEPWPPVKESGPSAGPFYLVWAHPELSAVAQEEWPFQLAGFDVKGSLKALYPAIFPGSAATAQVNLGFQAFTRNCLPCHTMNKSGGAEMGPDLNVPQNPTEYLTPAGLRTQVRDPQALRYFPKSRMSAFPVAILSDQELTAIISYLSYMAKHKIRI